MTKHQAPATGLIRLNRVLEIVPVGRSHGGGVRTGRFPQPLKLGPRTTAWRIEDIRKLLVEGAT